MAKGSDLDRVTAIVLREMRPPLTFLVLVYSLGVGVMILIPGVDGTYMSVLHAFYFMTYTATTTGFGELPHEFSDPQRLWATVCLFMSVVTWIFAIGTIIRLVQNPHFTLALAQARFASAVMRVTEPFFIICGFGDTGSLLARGLSDRRIRAVVIDSDVERIKALDLRDYMQPMPGLEGDASVPKNLQDAGISRANCQGVVLLTGDEDVNLKIAVMARLLNPNAAVICRSTTHAHEEELKGLGSVVVIDPFETWARELGLALHQPALHTLDEWLVGAHGVTLERLISHPRGTWILCGYGKLGRSLYKSLRNWNVHTVVIDPNIEDVDGVENAVRGLATRANLEAAGVAEAAGIVAATNRDADNLAILLTARNLNKSVHLIVRQNHHENELAFSAASADLIMQPSLVTARRLLLQVISPLVQEMLDHFQEHPEFLRDVVFPRLQSRLGSSSPALWTIRLDSNDAPALTQRLAGSGELVLGDILRDSRERDRKLACVPLMLRRGEDRIVLADDDVTLQMDDEILLCGTRAAQLQLLASLANEYTLEYLITGVVPVRSHALSWLRSWRAGTG
jgi:Trk K+ transport system NAD-binding subunit